MFSKSTFSSPSTAITELPQRKPRLLIIDLFLYLLQFNFSLTFRTCKLEVFCDKKFRRLTGQILEILYSHSFLSYQKGERVRIRAIYEGKRKKTQIKGGTEKCKTQKARKNTRKVHYQYEKSEEFDNRAISKLVCGDVRLNRQKVLTPSSLVAGTEKKSKVKIMQCR